jgi:hypothetical protein
MLVEHMLQWLHDRRGLPYVRKWRFPGQWRNVFCYRIDSDYGTQQQVKLLYDVASEHDIAMTWFLHVEAHSEWLSLFSEFRNQEIAVHGYRHRTFGSYDANLGNISEAKYLLKREGFSPDGFAAPNGRWNPAVARAAEDHGFSYASEFALDYDDLPFFPWLRYRFSDLLQVPIHPVCIGSLLRVHASDRSMKEYFRSIADRKLRREEPIIFYHHPGHGHPEVMADTFDYMREQGIRNITMGEYVRWWRRRATTTFAPVYDGRTIAVHSGNVDDGVMLCVDLPDGTRGFIGLEGEFPLQKIAWGKREDQEIELPKGLSGIRRRSIRTIQHSIEDFNARVRQ